MLSAIGAFDFPLRAIRMRKESFVVGGIRQKTDAPVAQIGFAGAFAGQFLILALGARRAKDKYRVV